MGNIPARHRYPVYDYSTFDFANNIQLTAERRYFNNVITGQQNILSVMGDGASLASALPFLEPVIIHATANVSLNDLRIQGTRVLVFNNTVATITVNIGTTGVPVNIDLPSYDILYAYFDGTNWKSLRHHIFNSEYLGLPYMLSEDDRPAAWVLGGGSAVAPNWTDVDFSAYVETGTYLKGLILLGMLSFTGDNAQDIQYACIRQNGSTENDDFQTRIMLNGYSNLAAGTLLKTSSVFTSLCDTSGIIEYIVSDAQASLSLTPLGYILESRL